MSRANRPWRRVALALGLVALVAVINGFVIEPRWRLRRDEVALELDTAPFRLVHLTDLHLRAETPTVRKMLAAVAAAQPELITISGDLVTGGEDTERLRPSLLANAAVLGQLRRVAPVVAAQGHSEFLGPVVAYLAEAGVDWLSNEGRVYGAPEPSATELSLTDSDSAQQRHGGFVLLGLNQQVGHDLFPPWLDLRFEPLTVDGEAAWGHRESSYHNLYFHYDPSPSGLADLGGPLAWSAYELTVEMRIEDPEAEVGVAVHSRYPAGEDRMLRVRRPGGRFTRGAPFMIVPHGTGGSAGQLDTGVVPQPGRWYRLRVRTEATAEAVTLRTRVWPIEEPEPHEWQAWLEDRTGWRVEAGTVGLWIRGGRAAFRQLEVRSLETGGTTEGDTTAGDGAAASTIEPEPGALLLREPFTDRRPPAGWRDGTRGSRLEMALARTRAGTGAGLAFGPAPPGLPRIVLSHVPTVAPEAARRGIEAVLAGHTHGGQVRLPGLALITRTPLGPHYDRGIFDFAAPNRQGWTRLYINPGLGTSLLPVRFLCPPTYAVVEVGRQPANR